MARHLLVLRVGRELSALTLDPPSLLDELPHPVTDLAAPFHSAQQACGTELDACFYFCEMDTCPVLVQVWSLTVVVG